MCLQNSTPAEVDNYMYVCVGVRCVVYECIFVSVCMSVIVFVSVYVCQVLMHDDNIASLCCVCAHTYVSSHVCKGVCVFVCESVPLGPASLASSSLGTPLILVCL